MSFTPPSSSKSLSEVHESIDTTSTSKKGFKKALAFLGPAYLVSVGYMDPGNWATDLQGGAAFGYQLIWVLLLSNLMALLLQSLSARLGIVRRRDLAQANRELYPPVVNFCLYILAEIAIAACDLAEVLGMALGFHLLTGLPLTWGIAITVLDTFILLWLQKFGIRKLEAFIISLVALIGLSFLIEIIIAKPNLAEVATGFIPTNLNKQSLYIAVAIIGATVMPHNLYLHSALVQTRKIGNDITSIKKAIKWNIIDSAIALNAAFFVNAAILVLAASTFFYSGHYEVARIEDAHALLSPLLGSKFAPILFAVALMAAGQSSTLTGTLAGQIVMEGYLKIRINPWLRRLLTRLIAIVPALIVIAIYGDKQLDTLLILSQVILSIQLGFAVIPLIHFVSDKATMGEFVIKSYTKIIAWLVALILIYLNFHNLIDQTLPILQQNNSILVKIVIIVFALFFIWLLLTTTFLPLIKKQFNKSNSKIHGEEKLLSQITINPHTCIAIALDFSLNDEHLIANALAQGNPNTTYLLIHIVESASAKYLGTEVDDDETRKDKHRLEQYVAQLNEWGYKATYALGYRNRIKEIIRLVNQNNANLLVMGAHRHTGIKDYLFGETIESVRHQISIPVLIVNV